MESQAKVMGHPLHPMLVVFPLGLLATALVFDLIFLGTDNGRIADAAYWMIVAGVIGGLVAAVPGLIDWLAIPSGTRAKAIGLYHAVLNVVVLGLSALSWYARRDDPAALGLWEMAPLWLGVGLALPSGWLGGELVDRLGVGVDDGAHLNAPSSLSGRPASEVSEGRDVAYPPAVRAEPAGRHAAGAVRGRTAVEPGTTTTGEAAGARPDRTDARGHDRPTPPM